MSFGCVRIILQTESFGIILKKRWMQYVEFDFGAIVGIGIIAYGSIIDDPSGELDEATSRIIEDIKTPFEVEYARISTVRSNAPTLAPVPDGKGRKVPAKIFVLKEGISEEEAKNILYRREIGKIGKLEIEYDENIQKKKPNPVLIKSLSNFGNLECVFYVDFKIKCDQILGENLSHNQKGRKLAELAVASVSKETYFTSKDGIQYLSDRIKWNIITPLTEIYKMEILNLAEHASSLEEARYFIAKQKGII